MTAGDGAEAANYADWTTLDTEATRGGRRARQILRRRAHHDHQRSRRRVEREINIINMTIIIVMSLRRRDLQGIFIISLRRRS